MGNHSGAAAVIDLAAYRRKRAVQQPPNPTPSTPGSAPVVVWVMVWPMG